MKFKIKKHLIFIVFALAFASISEAQEGRWAVKNISKDLLENAHTVIRLDESELEISASGDKKSLKSRRIVTILNENGLENSYFQERYDKFSKISEINGIVYDADGKKIKRIKGEEILDVSGISSSMSLFEDNRIKVINPRNKTYPFTVEYSYTQDYKETLFYPPWYFISSPNTSVEKSTYKVIISKEMKLRYKEINSPTPVKINNLDKNTEYVWEATQLKAIEYEPFSNFEDFLPHIILAPSKFVMDDVWGNLSNWNEFGNWIVKLNDGRGQLTPEFTAKLQKMTENVKTSYEKAKIVYEYLQNNSRYVSVQVGIGGFQPFKAADVCRWGYGDCKGLTNYMKAMLDAVGVNSYYTLVKAGEDATDISFDFPSSRFNHAFLCLPLENDTIWVECTSQRTPFGYNGTFTDDRHVLLIEPTGGKLVNTNVYKDIENATISKSEISFNERGDGFASITTKYIGLAYDDIAQILLADAADQKKLVTEKTSISNFILNSFNFTLKSARIPEVTEKSNYTLPSYISLVSNRMFLKLCLLNKKTTALPRISERISDVYIKRSSMTSDTVSYQIPENFEVESLPKGVNLSSQFGDYSSSITEKAGKIEYIRTLKMKKSKATVTEYSKLYEFFEKIIKADGIQVVMKKKV